jgi:hypothetical protein
VFLFLSSSTAVFSQDPKRDKDEPSTLEKYDVVARGKMSLDRGERPVQIVRMDNNGEILFACVNAKTIEQLKSIGIKFRQSQLELLIDWNLLEYDRKNKTYRTTIHVYGAEKAAAIRQQVKTAVKQLANTLKSDLDSLKTYLDRIDRRKNMFAILYAYVFHTYAMGQFGKEIYREPQLSAEHPFWNGFAWAIYPVRKFPTGVTYMPVEGNKFFFVSAAGVPRIDFRQITAFVKDVAIDNKLNDPVLMKSLASFGLIDKKGILTIPIFEREWSTTLENMAKKVYVKTIELVDSPELKDMLGMATQAQAAMFLHYEIRYAFLDYLLEQEMIEAPVDFKNTDNNSPKDVRNMVFLMKTAMSD